MARNVIYRTAKPKQTVQPAMQRAVHRNGSAIRNLSIEARALRMRMMYKEKNARRFVLGCIDGKSPSGRRMKHLHLHNSTRCRQMLDIGHTAGYTEYPIQNAKHVLPNTEWLMRGSSSTMCERGKDGDFSSATQTSGSLSCLASCRSRLKRHFHDLS